MARKPISEDTQKAILLKSRRRCCLCFWLKGIDEVQKGQIAHIDQDNENAEESNLAFLCFDHHDEYDGTTRLAKGLKPNEVVHWRDELYREMEYRFRSFQKRGFEVSIARFKWLGPNEEFTAVLRLKNVGEVAARSPTVTIRLPREIGGTLPERREEFGPIVMGTRMSMPVFDPFAASESRQDIFEPNGRVCVWELGGRNPLLMPGHSDTFNALLFRFDVTLPGSEVSLEYRVDAEDCPPSTGTMKGVVPSRFEDFYLNVQDDR
jgi:hypothetical protein